MKHRLLAGVLFLLFLTPIGAQEPDPSLAQDTRYLEDQFYIGLNYNVLLRRPERVTQNNLSYGIQAGFIKDLPLNASRTFGLGIGLGYAVNSYYSNLRAIRSGEDYQYILLTAEDSYKRNKIETHLIELPLEVRWRNSTATDYNFWRIYGGFKFGYVVGSRSKFVSNDLKDTFYNTDTENFQYGLILNIGYNTLNLHAYYGLNSLFEDGVEGPDGSSIEMVPLRVGLIFYIL